MKIRELRSSHPFKFNPETLELEFDPIEIKEGELPVIPKIWYEERDDDLEYQK